MTVQMAALRSRFPGADGNPDHRPRYNIAPTQTAPVLVTGSAGRPVWVSPRWGFRGPNGALVINARIETAETRPMFRSRLARGRCLIPADGFFEWAAAEGRGQRRPYRFVRDDGAIFALAGLWQPPRAPDDPGAFVVMTTRANALVAPVHSRMPILLPPEREEDWLNLDHDFEGLREALSAPFEAKRMRRQAVSPAVNRADRDDPECIAPAPAQGWLLDAGKEGNDF